MPCSVCGLSGHNKTTCARNRAERISYALAKYGASQVVARGLDVVCPGLGMTYEAANVTMALIRASKGRGVNEEDLFDAFMSMAS